MMAIDGTSQQLEHSPLTAPVPTTLRPTIEPTPSPTELPVIDFNNTKEIRRALLTQLPPNWAFDETTFMTSTANEFYKQTWSKYNKNDKLASAVDSISVLNNV